MLSKKWTSRSMLCLSVFLLAQAPLAGAEEAVNQPTASVVASPGRLKADQLLAGDYASLVGTWQDGLGTVVSITSTGEIYHKGANGGYLTLAGAVAPGPDGLVELQLQSAPDGQYWGRLSVYLAGQTNPYAQDDQAKDRLYIGPTSLLSGTKPEDLALYWVSAKPFWELDPAFAKPGGEATASSQAAEVVGETSAKSSQAQEAPAASSETSSSEVVTATQTEATQDSSETRPSVSESPTESSSQPESSSAPEATTVPSATTTETGSSTASSSTQTETSAQAAAGTQASQSAPSSAPSTGPSSSSAPSTSMSSSTTATKPSGSGQQTASSRSKPSTSKASSSSQSAKATASSTKPSSTAAAGQTSQFTKASASVPSKPSSPTSTTKASAAATKSSQAKPKSTLPKTGETEGKLFLLGISLLAVASWIYRFVSRRQK